MTEFRPARFEILPIVIKNLLIINVLVFLAQNTIGRSGFINMEALFGLHHVKSPLFEPWQIITHMFLHGGTSNLMDNLPHLIYNMFALWMFGSTLENLWGPKKFLTFYFLCGIGAALIQLTWLWFQSQDLLNQFMSLKLSPSLQGFMSFYDHYGLSQDPQAVLIFKNYFNDPNNSTNAHQAIEYVSAFTNMVISEPTIGASGAIFGVLAAFVYLFPNTNLYLMFLPIPIKAKWIGLAYFGFEIYSGVLKSNSDNIAHWAHIGGGLVGFLLVLTWNKKNRRTFY